MVTDNGADTQYDKIMSSVKKNRYNYWMYLSPSGVKKKRHNYWRYLSPFYIFRQGFKPFVHALAQSYPCINIVDFITDILEVAYENYVLYSFLDTSKVAAKKFADDKYAEAFALVKKMANYGKLGTYGAPILHEACIFKSMEIIKYLVEEKKIDIDMRAISGMTALMHVCFRGYEEIVQYLVEHGANVNAKCDFGRTPLWWALEGRNPTVANYLVSRGADINYKPPKEFSTLKEWAKGEFRLDWQ